MTATALPLLQTSGMAPASAGALLPVYRRFPVELVRGAGVELFDAQGRAYFDFTSGIAVNALGYGDPGLMAAMRGALEDDGALIHVSNLYHTAPAVQLAEALVRQTPADKVFFCNSGAEANEGAFKFARRWARTIGGPAKHEIVALRGSFHGRLFASLAATDRPGYRAPFRPLAGGVTIVERDIEDLDAALDAETVAALILEPVQGEGGVRVLDPDFLRMIRALTGERRIALITDEVQCGLGRTGRFLASEHSEIVPDLITLAKPLAGGLPMGAVLLSEEIASTIQPGDHATTFGGGPFVAAVARHVVDRVSDPALLDAVRENGEWLGAALRQLAERTNRIRAVRGIGYLWGVDVLEAAGDVVSRALANGLLLVSAGEHTIRFIPPLIATRDDLARGLALFEEALCSS